MLITILSLFPDFFLSPLDSSILRRARQQGLLDVHLSNIRDFTDDKHHTADDTPYGGGPGMVMKPDPLYRAIQAAKGKCQDEEVIFLSPKMAANLDNMAFTEFLLDNPNIILVIEDAEELIVSRNNHGNSHLSFLLNLTDGLIADSLGIQIIATFNTDVKNIDKALLRKGRLTAIYEFKELTAKKANELSKHLGLEYFDALQPMSLADIFNYKEANFSIGTEKVKIGF